MCKNKLACIILAGGSGSRMKSKTPKALHKVAGVPMLGWVVNAAKRLGPESIVVVASPQMKETINHSNQYTTVVQQKPLGTADAVKAGLTALSGFKGDILILLSDMPFLSSGAMKSVIKKKNESDNAGVAILGANFPSDKIPPFGRMVLNQDGTLAKIVEYKDASEDERLIRLCNTGALCISADSLKTWIAKISSENKQGEYYLTDLPQIAAMGGVKTHIAILEDMTGAMGVNSRKDLAEMETMMQTKLRDKAMENGVTLIDPLTVYFSSDTKIGQDVIIEPGVFFGQGVTIEDNVHIKAFSYIEGATIEQGTVIGPFARIRPHTKIGKNSKIGNFVELKNAQLGEGVKASHLSYIGDSQIGDHTNFSCGSITVNYDGFDKHKTIIGRDVMVGSNVNLVAPIEIGDGAFIAAGSTVSKNIPKECLAVARKKLTIREGWAASRRKKKAV